MSALRQFGASLMSVVRRTPAPGDSAVLPLWPDLDSDSQARVAFALAVGLSLTSTVAAILVCRDLSNDVATYYGRLALALAEGRWHAGFHPMIPPLVPVLAALPTRLGLDPYTSLKLVGGLTLTATLWPLRSLLRRIVSPALTHWSALVFICASGPLRYALRGTLEGPRMLFLVLSAERIVAWRETQSTGRALAVGAAVAGLSLTRGEGIAFLPLALCLMLWPTRLRNSIADTPRCPAARWRHAAAAVGIVLLLCLPWILFEWHHVGIPCTDLRQAQLVRRVFSFESAGPQPVRHRSRVQPVYTRNPEQHGLGRRIRNVENTISAFSHTGIAAIIGIVLLWGSRSRHSRYADLVAAGFIVYNLALFHGLGLVTKRYVRATLPFVVPYSTVALCWTGHLIVSAPVGARRALRFVVSLGILGFLFGGYWNTAAKFRPPWPRDAEPAHVVGLWLREHRAALDVNPHPGPSYPPRSGAYYDGLQPVVFCQTPAVAFWAGCGTVRVLGDEFSYPYDALVAVCERSGTDILVMGRESTWRYVDFEQQNARHGRFRRVTGHPLAEEAQVYTFVPAATTTPGAPGAAPD